MNKVRVNEIRRVLLLNYIEEDDSIEIRHYTVTVSFHNILEIAYCFF